MEEQKITFTSSAAEALQRVLATETYDRLFILVDVTTRQLCLPLIAGLPQVAEAQIICIGAGDVNKNIESLTHVWQQLSDGRASRKSLMINLGGGMVTDLGGFAAATFKRGIRFVNIPTTLLAMVDASAGGKTGINLGGLKNEIGAFRNALEVIVDTHFLQTLDAENITSGFAEMLKHSLISQREDWAELMRFDLSRPDLALLGTLVEKSVGVKRRIVKIDPEEHGLRKALNFGHSAGHALESLALAQNRPVLHGYAVAWGMVCELYLCCQRLGFPHDVMLQTIQYIKDNYGVFAFDCTQYDQLFELMQHDKKNADGIIYYTLLSNVGQIEINQPVTRDEILAMLDFYRETMGC